MNEVHVIDWNAVIADPRFKDLRERKRKVLAVLMIVSMAYFFALPVGAAYFQNFFKIKVWGVINIGLLFALSEFVVAWGVAIVYSRIAHRKFDRLAADIARDYSPRSA